MMLFPYPTEKKVIVVNNETPGFENIIAILKRYDGVGISHVYHKALPRENLARLLINADAVILSGGYGVVDPSTEEVQAEKQLIDLAVSRRIPVLGICYGFQLISELYGGPEGKILQFGHPIIEAVKIEIIKNDRIFEEIDSIIANQYHEDFVPYLSDKIGKLHVLAVSKYGRTKIVEAVKSEDGLLYGVQFHPERISGEANAHKVLSNFLNMVL